MASEMKIPSTSLILAADLLAAELKEAKPFGVDYLDRHYLHDDLVGDSALFSGGAGDANTKLVIEVVPAARESSCDAVVCRLERGDERLFFSHYLAFLGESSEAFTNGRSVELRHFVRTATAKIKEMEKHQAIVDALHGMPFPAVPFDWQDYR
jgi:hypothetical protein